MELKDALIKVTLPSDKFIASAPEAISVQAPGSKSIQASLISRAPSTDPQIQGLSFFYSVPSQATGLVPGLNVGCKMPVGPDIKGTIVPLFRCCLASGQGLGLCANGPGTSLPGVRYRLRTRSEEGYFVSGSFQSGRKGRDSRAPKSACSRELLPSEPAGGAEEAEDGDGRAEIR